MNILFLTLVKLNSLDDTMVYTDMLNTFSDFGQDVFAICPLEKRDKKDNYVERKKAIQLLHANIGGDYFNTNIFEKGITLVTLEKSYIRAIKEYYSQVVFDIILYTTPPITFNNVVEHVKKRDNAVSYLMLKDIFPQNAVDIGIMSATGIKGFIYKYFRKKEKKLYEVSDIIGCMSKANIKYILQHNPEISCDRVELLPNSIIIRDMSISGLERSLIRKKHDIPQDKRVFVYGGNLGKPQGIDFLVECLKKAKDIDALFLVVGDGTDRYKLQEYIDSEKPSNMKLMNKMSKAEYDMLVGACDVGMIFLDHSFTIPNFPSRLLSYMQAKIPVLAVTDSNTDIGDVIVEGKFGWWCESNDASKFIERITCALDSDLHVLGENGYEYLKQNYDVEDSVKRILSHLRA